MLRIACAVRISPVYSGDDDGGDGAPEPCRVNGRDHEGTASFGVSAASGSLRRGVAR